MCGRVPKTVRIEMTDSPTSTKPYEVLPRGGGILIQPVDGGPEALSDEQLATLDGCNALTRNGEITLAL